MTPATAPDTGVIRVNMVDGRRLPFSVGRDVRLRVIDGNKETQSDVSKQATSVIFQNLPFHDNLGDLYTVVASCSGYQDSGIYPVRLKNGGQVDANLMLIPSGAKFHFRKWEDMQSADPRVLQLLTNGTTSPAQRYSDTFEAQNLQMGALLTLGTAIRDIVLDDGITSALSLDFHWEVWWDHIAQDRFWAWVDARLADRIKKLAALNAFAEEADPAHWHPANSFAGPATRSWKQTRFDVCNVQLTFHENDRTERLDANGNKVQCVLVEPDIDYFKDTLAHGLLEVIPNAVTKGLTDPRVVYSWRWMASLQEGLAPFDPPCTIE